MGATQREGIAISCPLNSIYLGRMNRWKGCGGLIAPDVLISIDHLSAARAIDERTMIVCQPKVSAGRIYFAANVCRIYDPANDLPAPSL